MNILVLSPNFPTSNMNLCSRLLYLGANVLGIGDTEQTNIPNLQNIMTHYYKVDSLEDYESVYKACCFFISKYGRIDKIISLSNYWLPLEIKLNNEFHLQNTATPAIVSNQENNQYCYSAILNDKGEPVAEFNYSTLENGDIITSKTVNTSLSDVALKAIKKAKISSRFATVCTTFESNKYKVTSVFATLSPLVLDLMNYALDCDLYCLYALMLLNQKPTLTVDTSFVCYATKTNNFNDYCVEDESILVQQTNVEDIFVTSKDEVISIFKLKDENELKQIFGVANSLPEVKVRTPRAKKEATITTTKQAEKEQKPVKKTTTRSKKVVSQDK